MIPAWATIATPRRRATSASVPSTTWVAAWTRTATTTVATTISVRFSRRGQSQASTSQRNAISEPARIELIVPTCSVLACWRTSAPMVAGRHTSHSSTVARPESRRDGRHARVAEDTWSFLPPYRWSYMLGKHVNWSVPQ